MRERTDGMVEAIITLERIEPVEMRIKVQGITPLVTNKFSEKAKAMIRDKQTSQTTRKKAPKDIVKDYEAAFHRLPDGAAGIPASAFKGAAVAGARNFEAISMVQVKQAIFVLGEGPDQLIKIEGEPEMWEAPVRIAKGGTDLRHRPRFFPWACEFDIMYNDVILTKEAVIALVDAGGLAGVGEWRPSSPKSTTGSYGMYRVVTDG